MSRKRRLYGDSGIYHVILRGNNKQNLFNFDSDKKFFIAKLKKYSTELKIRVYAYCLMNNHVHILIGEANDGMGLMIQKIANSYVSYFNLKYDRCGHLFQGRYKSEPVVDDEQFKTVYRYILQNCEKAGIGKTEEYEWNSYKSVEKKVKSENDFIDVDYVCDMFGSKKELLEFILQKEKTKCMEYENKVVFSDDRAVRLIMKIFGISSPYSLERLDVEEQIGKCKIMKSRGLSINQIVRITGVSRLIVRQA